jgi:hypothetical protein
LAQELSAKRLELLKEIVPKLSRVAVLGTSTIPGNAQALKETHSPPPRSACSFNTWTYKITRILRPHPEPSARVGLTEP